MMCNWWFWFSNLEIRITCIWQHDQKSLSCFSRHFVFFIRIFCVASLKYVWSPIPVIDNLSVRYCMIALYILYTCAISVSDPLVVYFSCIACNVSFSHCHFNQCIWMEALPWLSTIHEYVAKNHCCYSKDCHLLYSTYM